MQKLRYAETLLIEGPDAVAFAHAQFSSNVIALANDHWQFSAWLDPSGRVRHFFHLARLADDRLLILLRGGTAASMAESLSRFVFRSNVVLAVRPTRALRAAPPAPLETFSGDEVALCFGCGAHSLQITNDGDGDDGWHLMQLRQGWPWIPDTLLRTLLASSLSLQRLQAVMIDKGCYPGQEIVARMHFRSGHKKHLHRVVLSQAEIAGGSVRAHTQERGYVVDVINGDEGIEALAVLNDEFVAQAIDENLPITDHGLIIRLLETWPA